MQRCNEFFVVVMQGDGLCQVERGLKVVSAWGRSGPSDGCDIVTVQVFVYSSAGGKKEEVDMKVGGYKRSCVKSANARFVSSFNKAPVKFISRVQ